MNINTATPMLIQFFANRLTDVSALLVASTLTMISGLVAVRFADFTSVESELIEKVCGPKLYRLLHNAGLLRA